MQLTLSSDYVFDTIMTNSEGQVIYKTTTPGWTSRTTTIWKIRPSSSPLNMRDEFDVLAEIEWHTWTSSKFRFDGKEVRAQDYIPSSGLIKRNRAFTAPDGKKYKWMLERRRLALELGDGSDTPVACLHNRSYGVIGEKHPSYLEIYPAGEHILDTIVMTFIYVEKLRKDEETAAITAAAVS